MSRLLTILLVLNSSLFSAILKPALKFSGKGGGPYLMNGGYAGSPAVVDLDHDGDMEIIWADYMIYVIEGNTGTPVWNVYSGHDRSYTGKDHVGNTYPAVVVADLDGNDTYEIVTAHSQGHVSIYNSDGYFYNNSWPVKMNVNSEIRALCAANLDHNGVLEILVGSVRTDDNDFDWYVLQLDGSFFPGWPQRARVNSGHGTFNQNMAVADINNDGFEEIIGLSDNYYLHALQYNGEHLPAGAVYNFDIWSKIPLWLDLESELRGWAEDGELQPKFYFSSAVVDDLNSDQIADIITISCIHERSENNEVSSPRYHTPIILQPDRTRFNENGFDWTVFPTPKEPASSGQLEEDWRVIKVCLPNPVTADIDGDGYKEVIYPANDGKMHVCWLDKTEHHNWPYHVTKSSEDFIRFATAAAVADLNNDGKAEIIFGSWTPINSGKFGKLHLLDWQGNVLHEIIVPASERGWNGITSAPTMANIDDDPDLEVVVGTAWSGICAYDLPGTDNAQILWQTGQMNYQRTGGPLPTVSNSAVHSDWDEPQSASLLANYPNPFNNATIIHLNLKKIDFVTVDVYNLTGRRVLRLFEGRLEYGEHNFRFSDKSVNRELSSGVYLCRIKGTDFSRSLKMLLLR